MERRYQGVLKFKRFFGVKAGRSVWKEAFVKTHVYVNLSATHRFAYIPEGADGNNYPVVVGGGYRMDGATVMILQKKGKEMTLRVLNAKGETLKELNL